MSMEEQVELLRAQINAEMEARKATKDIVKEKIEEVSTEIAIEETVSKMETIESTVDPFLEQALKEGYDPNYNGPNKKSPEQFVKDGSFFRKIDSLNKKIDELTEFNRQTMEHNRKLEKASYEKALRDLQMEKLEAIRQGEVDKVLNIEKQAEAVYSQIKNTEIPTQTAPAAPVISEDTRQFQEKHKDWLHGTSAEDKSMQVMAKKIIEYLNETNPSISEREGIKEIEKRLKNEFPHRFGNPNQENASLTSESTVSSSSQEKDYSSMLSTRQKEFYKNAKKYGSKLTLKEYANQLRLIGDLKDE